MSTSTLRTPAIYCEYRVDTWDSARILAKQLSPDWIFRGQKVASWQMTTSFERAVAKYAVDSGRVRDLEREILDTFKRRAHRYASDIPAHDAMFEWISLLQHYSGPTRLIDFTHSFYAACFFALEESDASVTESAVFAVHSKHLLNGVKQAAQKLGAIKAGENPSPQELSHEIAKFAFEQVGSAKFAVVVDPRNMNDRIAAQQGLFMFPFDLGSSFEENLFGGTGGRAKVMAEAPPVETVKDPSIDYGAGKLVVKIVIPRSLRKEILLDLRRMNISHASLFPGLDGFGKSLHHHLELA